MSEEEDFTAYCGLFCQDCIPSNAQLFRAVRDLLELSTQLRLDLYAQLKSNTNEAFSDYEVFAKVLSELATLQCPAPCRHGGGKADCPIRECARARRYFGCWECSVRRECELLLPLRRFHGETIDGNLDAIARDGLGGWADKRGRHYPWS
jgi:hypothetical protein